MSDQLKTLEQLGQEWVTLKSQEEKANKARLAIEEEIIAITGKRDEGSKTHEVEGFKVTVTGKLTRSMDWAKWELIKDSIPQQLHPVKMKAELDETGVRYLQLNEPEIYARLPVTVKPAKTGIKVEIKV